MHKLTEEQAAIVAAMKDDDDHLEGRARAGTGKTETATLGAAGLPHGSFMTTFNRAAANTLRDRLMKHAIRGVEAATMNSKGFRILRDNNPDVRCVASYEDPDAKLRPILEGLVGEPRSRREREAFNDTARLVKLAKANLVEQRSDLEDVADTFGMDFGGLGPDKYVGVAQAALAECRRIYEARNEVDFDDQQWLPVVLGLEPVRVAPAGVIDESQDLNKCQHALVLKLAQRIIYIGDERQSLYSFRGADTDSMGRLRELLDGHDGRKVKTLPLTINWRCGSDIIALAQKLVPDIRAHEGAWKGEVRVLDGDVMRGLEPAFGAALARTNAPLVGAALSCIRRNVPAVVRGRDFGKGLESLAQRLGNGGSLEAMLGALAEYEDHERARILASKRSTASKLSALEDRCMALRVASEGCTSVAQVVNRLLSLFSSDERGAIVCSTVHRFKGDERRDVAVLEPTSMPHPRAREEEALGEANVAYVAVTRAKERLWFEGCPPPILGLSAEETEAMMPPRAVTPATVAEGE